MQARSAGLSNCVEPWGQAGHRFTAFSWSGSRHGSKAGYSSGVAGVDTRRATPPDPRPPHWGLAGCCQLDPSHPTLVTCAVGREGRHAPRPNDVGGQPRFPGARQGVTPLLCIGLTFPTKVPSDSLGRIGSLKRTSDKSRFPMALDSCGHRNTHQLRPINVNGRSILAVTS